MGNFLKRLKECGSFGTVIVEYITKFLNWLGDIGVDKEKRQKIINYVEPLVYIHFNGETSGAEDYDTKESILEGTDNHLGLYLKKLDQIFRQYNPNEFDVDTCQEFRDLLRKCCKCRVGDSKESEESCYQILLRDARKFQKIFRSRAEKHPELATSEELNTLKYWGTRQQLLAAKVICDWIVDDTEPRMDPIFGVLLNPTAGRVGPGDSGLLHNVTFDWGCGRFGFHAAVHDAFGYLLNYHDVGPGYNYMCKSLLATLSPYSGQLSGLAFWKKYLKKVPDREDPSFFQFL